MSGIASLEPICRSLKTRLNRPWAWDGRFGAALLTFTKDEKEVAEALSAALPNRWGSSQLAAAGPRVQEMAEACGGLDPGQYILVSDPKAPAVLVATLWPWGNAKTVSLRVTYWLDGLNDDQRGPLDAELKVWFGVG